MAKDRNVPLGIGLLGGNAKVYNTIAEMQSDSKLKAGKVVEVLGYYQAGDGAGHKRVIADSDDGSGVQLGNGLWANIIHNGEVNVSWFGAKGDGVTDDRLLIQKAIDYNVSIFLDIDVTIMSDLLVDNKQIYLFSNDNSKFKINTGIRAKFSNCTSINMINIGFITFGGITTSTIIPLHILSSENINIKDCYFSLKRAGNQVGDGYYTFKIDTCNNIKVDNIIQESSYPEGMCFERCSDVVVENSKFLVGSGNTWTNLHMFYSNNCVIKNCYIDGGNSNGSTINFNVNKGLIIGNTILGGNGIDISNETSVEFLTQNIEIKDNFVNVKDVCVYDYPSLCNSLKINGNTMITNGTRALLNLMSTNIEIENNIFESSSSVNTFPMITTGGEKNSLQNILIKNNKAKGCSIFIRLGLTCDTLTVLDNIVELIDVEDNSGVTYNFGNFIVTNNAQVNLIKLERNTVKNIGGAVIQNRVDIASDCKFVIKDNDFSAKENLTQNRWTVIKPNVNLEMSGNHFTNVKGAYFLTTDSVDKHIITNNSFISTGNKITDVIRGTLNKSSESLIGFNVYQNTQPSLSLKGKYDLPTDITIQLNNPTMQYAMELEGVKQDYLEYSLDKFKYDKQLEAEEQARYEAYSLLLKENPNLTWEEFEQQYGNNVMMNLSLVERLEEPTIPESVKKFMEKYL